MLAFFVITGTVISVLDAGTGNKEINSYPPAIATAVVLRELGNNPLVVIIEARDVMEKKTTPENGERKQASGKKMARKIFEAQVFPQKEIQVFEREGKPLSKQKAVQLLKKPRSVLVSENSQTDPFFLRVVRKDTPIVVVHPGEVTEESGCGSGERITAVPKVVHAMALTDESGNQILLTLAAFKVPVVRDRFGDIIKNTSTTVYAAEAVLLKEASLLDNLGRKLTEEMAQKLLHRLTPALAARTKTIDRRNLKAIKRGTPVILLPETAFEDDDDEP